MIGYIVLAFIVYFVYRFIVGFVLPVVRTANQMKRKVNEMNRPFEQSGGGQEGRQQQGSQTQTRVEVNGARKGPFSRFTAKKATGQGAKPSKSDYIEFEEVK